MMNSSIKRPAPVNGAHSRQIRYFLFAGRRIEYLGKKCLKLIKPHSGRHFYVEEKKLNKASVYLGSFLHAMRTTRRVLYDFEPMEKPKKFKVNVKGDVAYLENLQCTLVEEGNLKIFKSKTLGDILCQEQLELGEYLVRVHLMERSMVTDDGRRIHFEGKYYPLFEMPTFKTLQITESRETEDIETLPSSKLILNPPFNVKNTYRIKITNPSENRIGFGVKTNQRKRFRVNPKFGVLDPNESISVSITSQGFVYDPSADRMDKVKIGWINAPEGAGKVFQQKWFKHKDEVRHRSLKIEYK